MLFYISLDFNYCISNFFWFCLTHWCCSIRKELVLTMCYKMPSRCLNIGSLEISLSYTWFALKTVVAQVFWRHRERKRVTCVNGNISTYAFEIICTSHNPQIYKQEKEGKKQITWWKLLLIYLRIMTCIELPCWWFYTWWKRKNYISLPCWWFYTCIECPSLNSRLFAHLTKPLG